MSQEPEIELIDEGEIEATPEQLLKKLHDKLKLCQTERQEFLETSQRLRADYVNLKRESDSSGEKLAKFANEKLLLEIIGLADNFEQAVVYKDLWEKAPLEWRRGIEQIYHKLKSVLRRYGVEEVEALGQTFNPAEHQALAVLDTEKKEEDNMVMEIVQKGYRLHDRIIRPAGVKIGHQI